VKIKSKCSHALSGEASCPARIFICSRDCQRQIMVLGNQGRATPGSQSGLRRAAINMARKTNSVWHQGTE